MYCTRSNYYYLSRKKSYLIAARVHKRRERHPRGKNGRARSFFSSPGSRAATFFSQVSFASRSTNLGTILVVLSECTTLSRPLWSFYTLSTLFLFCNLFLAKLKLQMLGYKLVQLVAVINENWKSYK